MPKNEPFMMNLKCRLTEEDRAVISTQIVEKLSVKEEFEASKAAATAQWGGKIKEINKEISSLAKKHREGYETRPVECYTHFNWADSVATVHRSDTDEEISRRMITSSERQRHFDFEKEEKGIADQVEGAIDGLAGGESIPDGGGDPDAVQATEQQPRDDEFLHNALSQFMDEAPSVETIKGYSDKEFDEVLAWANAIILSMNSGNDSKVPAKPPFVGSIHKPKATARKRSSKKKTAATA